MASNPLVAQGALSKLLASAQFVSNSQLNAAASFFGPLGVAMRLEGQASAYLPTMTGAVPSPNPYQMATVTLHLLRTQGLSASYKAQFESNTSVGDLVVTPDASTLPTYTFTNCVLQNLAEMTFDGGDPGFVVTVMGTYAINASLFQ